MAGVPFIFGNATTAIPLTNLDADFNTTATLGNASIGLGNTTTTVGNLTLTNVTITSGSANVTTVGNAAITGGSINNTVIGNVTPSTAVFTTANVTTQLNLTNASNYNLNASGAGANYMAGALGIGAVPIAGTNIYAAKNLTGSTTSFNIDSVPTIQSDVTSLAASYFSFMTTQAAAFTLTSIRHYDLASVTIGSGSTVTNQIGYYARTLTTGTNNYAFQGTTAAATNAFNLYMSGTANNYLAGALGIGTSSLTANNLSISKNSTGGTITASVANTFAVQSDVTNTAYGYTTFSTTQAASFTLSNLIHYHANQGTIGATSAITNQTGFNVANSLTGATNNYGFYGNIVAATGAYNLYMAGTAVNYLAGDLGVGTTTTTGYGKLTVQSTSSAVAFQLKTTTNVNGIYSTLYEGFFNTLYSYGSQFIVGTTDATAFVVNTNNTERMRVSVTGDVLVTGAGGLGYGTGSGGAVTQATSRTTGVTLNKTNGAITLVSAAGSVTYQSFTVTNSTVAATDTIIVNQKSGTDKYIILVTTVAAGSFQITFATTAGVTTEQPVFNFAVIKAVVA
jgi:hypothetical protein